MSKDSVLGKALLFIAKSKNLIIKKDALRLWVVLEVMTVF